MKLSNWLITHEIFTAIHTTAGDRLPELWAMMSDADLDAMLALNYGNRTMFDAVYPESNGYPSGLSPLLRTSTATATATATPSVEMLAVQILAMYSDKWAGLIAVELAKFNYASDGSRVLHESTTSTGLKNDNGETINKVSAMNAGNAFMNESGVDTTGHESTEGEVIHDLKEDKNSFSDLINNLSLADKLSIINVVLKDVANYLTIAIY